MGSVKEPNKDQEQAFEHLEELIREFQKVGIMLAVHNATDTGESFKLEFMDRTTGKHIAELDYLRLIMLGNQEFYEFAKVGTSNDIDIYHEGEFKETIKTE